MYLDELLGTDAERACRDTSTIPCAYIHKYREKVALLVRCYMDQLPIAILCLNFINII